VPLLKINQACYPIGSSVRFATYPTLDTSPNPRWSELVFVRQHVKLAMRSCIPSTDGFNRASPVSTSMDAGFSPLAIVLENSYSCAGLQLAELFKFSLPAVF
jgi:hypothetical protein